MEKRVIIAFVLSFAILYAFRALYSPPPTPPGQPAETRQSTETAPAGRETASAQPLIQPAEQVPTTAPEAAQAEKAEEIPIDTPLYTATISNVGGVLKSYRLKKYTDGEGRPLELINQL